MTTRRIAFFNSNQAWGGGEKWHLHTALALKKLGYSPLLITNIGSALFQQARAWQLAVYPIRVTNLSFANPAKVIALCRFFRKQNLDGIILNLPADAKLGGLAAKWAGIPKIIYRRGMAVPVRNSMLNRFLYRRVFSHIIANSEQIKKTILHNGSNLVDEEKIHVIYNGVDLDQYEIRPGRPLYAKAPGETVLGNAGRLVEQKGQKYLLQAAAILKAQGHKFKLLIAGSGTLAKSLEEQAAGLGLTETVIFLGFVESMKAFMDSIDIFVLSSVHEGSANALLEAMAYEKPVVAFGISSNPEIVVAHQTGLLAAFPDVHQFALHIETLIRNPDLSRSYGAQGRLRIAHQFDRTENIKRLLNLIND